MKLEIWLTACSPQAHGSVAAKWEQAEAIVCFCLPLFPLDMQWETNESIQ